MRRSSADGGCPNIDDGAGEGSRGAFETGNGAGTSGRIDDRNSPSLSVPEL